MDWPLKDLNNVSSTPNDILIILNDNNMSIDLSVGGMKEYLLSLNTNETYNAVRFKARIGYRAKIGFIKEDRRKGLIRLTNAIKSAISHQQNMLKAWISANTLDRSMVITRS